jgi:hypothetical protein
VKIKNKEHVLNQLKDLNNCARYAWFNKINDVYNKHIRADKDSLKPYQAKTEQLIKDTLILEDIDKTLPSFKIGPNYLEQIEEAGYDSEYEVAEL